METIDVGSKIFTNEELETYKLEYGIDIIQKDNKINLTGGQEELDIISARIRKEVFLLRNSPNDNEYNYVNDNENNISNNINNIKYETDYSRYGGF